jgi:hypothetical protein
MAFFHAAELGSSLVIPATNSWSPDAFGSGNSLTPLSRMHSAKFTAFSRAVLAVPALPEPAGGAVSEGAFEPQPTLISLIRATSAGWPRAAAFYSCSLDMCGVA